MDHNHAIESSAVERYLLSEMSADERDAFEDHYFSCSECAENVRIAVQFRDDARVCLGSSLAPARAAAKERKPGRKWWSLPQLIPVGVAAALAGVVVYLAGFEIPELKQRAAGTAAAQPIISVALHGVTRGEAEHIPAGGKFFGVYFDVPENTDAAPYQGEVTASNGRVAARIPALSPRRGEPVTLLLSRSDFPSGTYTITIRNSKIMVSQQNFIVE